MHRETLPLISTLENDGQANAPEEPASRWHQGVIAELVQEALAGPDLGRLAKKVAGQATETIGVDKSLVIAFDSGDAGRHRPSLVYLDRGVDDLPSEVYVRLQKLVTGGDSVAVMASPEQSDLAFHRWIRGNGYSTAIVARIGRADRPSGILLLLDRRRLELTESERGFLVAAAHVLSQATELQDARGQGRLSHTMLQAIVQHMPSLVWTTDTGLHIQHVLGSGLAQFAHYEGFLHRTMFEFFDTTDREFPPIAAHLAAIAGRTQRYRYELDGVLLDVKVDPLRNEKDAIVGCIGTAIDVTESEGVKKELDLLSAALESAANAVVITDRDGRVTWTNRAFTSFTGYTLQEVRGNTLRLLRSGVQSKELYRELWQTILSGKVWTGELINRRKDGTFYTEEQTITPIRDADGRIAHFIAIKQDVTARRELEKQFQHAQKMEAIGRLAGGVAHDFNNVLTAVLGYAQLLLQGLQDGDPRREELDEIQNAAERAVSLTRQLLAFSRSQVIKPRVLDLNASVAAVEKLLRRLIGEDVAIATSFESSLGSIKADPAQIEQVVMNLAVNARDAMPNGGRLTIETANREVTEPLVRSGIAVPAGSYVMLAVSDTGKGMDEGTVARVFEPFFTTKSKGTGLGLSTIYGIVNQAGGYILPKSKLGQGTRFEIYFPLCEEPPESTSSKRVQVSEPGGNETVLLVEDDHKVRSLVVRILRAKGYNVLEARNAGEAIHLLSELHKCKLDLLLTDIVMPMMRGTELAQHLRTLRPETKVLYMSGYSGHGTDGQGLGGKDSPVLYKPFAPQALLSRVREILDEPREGAGPATAT